jgi:hypothetical protein
VSENVISRSGSKRLKRDGRGAVIGAETDANLARIVMFRQIQWKSLMRSSLDLRRVIGRVGRELFQ